MAQPAQPAPAQPIPFIMEPPNFKELAPGASRSCAFYENTLVRKVFTVGMWIFTGVFAVAIKRHAITALTQRQAQFVTIALLVVDIIMTRLPNSKKDPKVQLGIRQRFDNELQRCSSSLDIVNNYAEEIKLGVITPDEVKRAVLVDVQKNGLKGVLLSDVKRARYLAQLQTYKSELQQLFAAELETSTWIDFCERHRGYALDFWDDNGAPEIVKTRLIEFAKSSSVAIALLESLGFLATCKKIPNGENELVKALVLHYVGQFKAGTINYYDLRSKIGHKILMEEVKKDATLKQPLKESFLKHKNESCLQDGFAEERKLLDITFLECLEGLPPARLEALRAQLRTQLERNPANIPEKKEQMDALGITCQSVYLKRWKENAWTLRPIMNDLNSHHALSLLEKPRELKEVFIAAMKDDEAIGKNSRFIDIIFYHPQLFEKGIFVPEDRDVVDQLNKELLSDRNGMVYLTRGNGMVYLTRGYETLPKGYVKPQTIETLLKRHYLHHLSDYCLGINIPYSAEIAKHQLLENTEVGKIILDISKEAKAVRNAPVVLVKDGRIDPSELKQQINALVKNSRAKLEAFTVKPEEPRK